jgi:hypothetical protein
MITFPFSQHGPSRRTLEQRQCAKTAARALSLTLASHRGEPVSLIAFFWSQMALYGRSR